MRQSYRGIIHVLDLKLKHSTVNMQWGDREIVEERTEFPEVNLTICSGVTTQNDFHIFTSFTLTVEPSKCSEAIETTEEHFGLYAE